MTAPTTSGAIAMSNLQAQIAGLSSTAGNPLLIDLLLQRGHVLGRIADYERATVLADQLVREAPHDHDALLTRARARATLHLFTEALTDLEAARRYGARQSTVDAERAAILQAVGLFDEAFALRQDAANTPSFTTLGALAALQAERGETDEAESLFTEAAHRYRDVSPFPLAGLDFRRGLMWLTQGDLTTARLWFDTVARLVPGYAPALGHLAELDAALGDHDAAIERLRPLRRPVTTPNTRATSPSASLPQATRRKPSGGAATRPPATTNWSGGIPRRSSITPPTSGSPQVATTPKASGCYRSTAHTARGPAVRSDQPCQHARPRTGKVVLVWVKTITPTIRTPSSPPREDKSARLVEQRVVGWATEGSKAPGPSTLHSRLRTGQRWLYG